jgi:hypothetical protein
MGEDGGVVYQGNFVDGKKTGREVVTYF